MYWTVVWAAPPVNTDAQDLSLTGNVLSLTNDATTVNLNSLVLTVQITDARLQPSIWGAPQLHQQKLPRALNTVLTTNVLERWSGQPLPLPDAQDLTLQQIHYTDERCDAH